MGLIKIIKKSVTPLAEKVGHIFNSTNIENKEENTYSAGIIDGLIDGAGKWEQVQFAMTTDTINTNRSRIYVNKVAKLVRVQIQMTGKATKGQYHVATIPSQYAPNIMPTDTCWFIMWHTNGDIANNVMFARGSITVNGEITVLSAYADTTEGLFGEIIYPYA